MGRTEMTQARVDLDDLVRETLRRLETATQGREITWKIASLPPVKGDLALLRQVFTNLIGNAIKYSRQRAPAVIEIGCSSVANGEVVVFVRDNGAGFDMKYANKLFGVFQRLHRAEEFEGTGIGLATVRRVIARHGGRVWAEAAVDAGATFYLTLKADDSTNASKS
jgi:light-regulated signal transduction histidine kinase (bacteriophytochrome)